VGGEEEEKVGLKEWIKKRLLGAGERKIT